MELQQANQVVTAPEWGDQIEVLSPNRLRVAALDRLGGITPAMIDWWFGRMDEQTYFRFHPVDHQKFAWVGGKQPGRYIGATHLTYHCYGGLGPVLRSHISFVPPAELLDERLFEAHGVGAAVCAVVHLLDTDDRPDAAEAGRFVHVAVERGYGTELRSCWWLNAGPESNVELLTTGRLRHVHEEFAYLTGFLPSLYTEEASRR